MKAGHEQIFFSATEYVVQLKREKRSMEEEVGRLQREIESLNTTINMCQEQLPASGVHVSRQRFTVMQQTFQQYVREQTARNFKFWIVSFLNLNVFAIDIKGSTIALITVECNGFDP
jgi:MAX-like protein X